MLSMDEVYRSHSQTVYRYLLSLTHDADAAEELTQETFYQAVRSVNCFDGTCKITTWLCGIAKNVLLAYRRKHPDTASWEEAAGQTASPEEAAVERAGQVALLQRLHLLEGDTREVLYLRLLGGLSFREIGDVLSRTENWARVTYYRGKEKLKKELENHE